MLLFNTLLVRVLGKWQCTKATTKQIVPSLRGPDVELATLRELPQRGILHNTNVLYKPNGPLGGDFVMLPHIRR